jgi:hypothetical protein
LFHLILANNINLPLPSVNLGAHFLQFVVAAPFVGGYLLARESKGNIYMEAASIALLEVAVIVPATFDVNTLTTLLFNMTTRWPIMLFVLGFAFIIDRNWKIIPGVVMVLVALGSIVGGA